MNNTFVAALGPLDVSHAEKETLSALIAAGPSTAAKLHAATGFERRTVHDALAKLANKGLVAQRTEAKSTVYSCVPPEKIRSMLAEKKAALADAEAAMPRIEELYRMTRAPVDVRLFRGKEGIKTVFEEMLNHQDNYFIGGGFYIMDHLPGYWRGYNERRIRRKVTWHTLSRHETKRRKVPESRLLNIKYLPAEFDAGPAVIFIYGDKVVNVLWGDEWFAFMIENATIATNYRRYFSYLWKHVAQDGSTKHKRSSHEQEER